MKHSLAITLVLLLCAAAVFAGCSGTQGSSASAPAGTGAGSSAGGASSSGNALVVSPTDVVPESNMVTIDVGEKDYLGKIPVTFQGGMGMIHAKKVDITVYLADGQVKTATVGTNKGDAVEIQGTKQTDRVVVYVTFDNGQRLKTNDVMSAYRTRQ